MKKQYLIITMKINIDQEFLIREKIIQTLFLFFQIN